MKSQSKRKFPRVNILLSTYNGEKFIVEQIESLLNQTYENIQIYVRDDGSTDGTFAILQGYEKKNEIKLICGKNLGFCGSFFELLRDVNEGDYWSFCDQDDIWNREKIERAVRFLEEYKGKRDIPLLYYSYSRMIDENGTNLGVQEPPKNSLCFRRVLTGTFGVGFSMVINRQLRDAMLECDSSRVGSHDWLAGAVALGLGEVIIDDHISATYRRLESSVTRISFSKRIEWFFKTFRDGGEVKNRNKEFSKIFYNRLSEKDRRYISLFDEEKYSLKSSVIKCFYPKRWRPSMSSEVIMRILMFLGKV